MLLSDVACAFVFYVIFVCVCWWLYCVVCVVVLCCEIACCLFCVDAVCGCEFVFLYLHIASLAFLFELIWRVLLRDAFKCVQNNVLLACLFVLFVLVCLFALLFNYVISCVFLVLLRVGWSLRWCLFFHQTNICIYNI